MLLNKLPGASMAKRVLRKILSKPVSEEKQYFLDDETFRHKPLFFYNTSLGKYYVPADATRDCIVACMKKGAIFEPEIVDVARRYIKKDSIVLDVGANLGQMSMLFAELTGAEGQVLSFEADDYIFRILQKNIDVNNHHNIRAYLAAVYDKDGKEMFFPVQDLKRFTSYGSYGLDPNAKEGRTIKTLTIDSLNIQDPISFMKIDIQGSDLFALKGAIQTIKKHQMPIIFEFEQQFQKDFNTSFQDYIDFIRSISYRVEEVVNGINYLIIPDAEQKILL
jgi:FkbM family methyltransferase